MLKLQKVISPKLPNASRLLSSPAPRTHRVLLQRLLCSPSPVPLPAPRGRPCPQRHRTPWHVVTGGEQVSSITSPCLGSATSPLHLRVSMEETKPPFSSLPLSSRGRELQPKPWAGGVMTAHQAASITCNRPASGAACQNLSTKHCQLSTRNSQTALLPRPHDPCSGWTTLKDGLHLQEASQLSVPAV